MSNKITVRPLVVLAIYLVVALIIIHDQTNTAEAATPKRIIGIYIEKSCLLSERCLDYKDIIYLDRSNKQISGEFVVSGDDIKRKCSKYQNNINWYSQQNTNKMIILVDPCFSQATYIPTITIVSKLDQYTTKGQMKIIEQNQTKRTIDDMKPTKDVREWSTIRYVDSKCNAGVIGYSDNWKNLIHDTINYMTNECDPAHTKIKTIISEERVLTKHDITTTQKYKLEKWQSIIKKECLQKRNTCTDLKQPVSKT